DVVEQRGRRPQFVAAADDGAHLQVPIDADVDLLHFANGVQLVEIIPQALEVAHLPASLLCSVIPVRVEYIYRNAIQEAGGLPMRRACCFAVLLLCGPVFAGPVVTLPNTKPLTEEGDLSKKMLDGLHRFAFRKVETSVKDRAKLWKRDPSSREAYDKSIQ